MAGSTILVLGGGWGGLAAAHHLRGLLPSEHRVVVVERKERFYFCPSYLWLMNGERAAPDDVSRPMANLTRPGIEWVHDEALQIDPIARTVRTGSGTLHGDQLIIALGAENAPGEVPGFVEGALDLYEASGAMAIRKALLEFEGGRIVVLITRTPFRCPGAPYEAAFLIDASLRQRGRERVEVAIYTPEKAPLPVAGPAIGAAIVGMLVERGIAYHPERTARRIDPASRTITFDGEEVSYDLLVGIPPHRSSAVVRESGFTDATGYIPAHPQTLQILADPETLETRYPGVFAMGDVASIRLLNGLLLPKTGVFAEGEARVVAENVAAAVRGVAMPARYDGVGGCYLEVGQGMAAYGVGNFFAYPGPRLTLEPPSVEAKRGKEQFERVLENWFTS